MADGTIRILPILLIKELRIGQHCIRNVPAGVSPTGEMLLAPRGQRHRSIHNRQASEGVDLSLGHDFPTGQGEQ